MSTPRPARLADFTGQPHLVTELGIILESARQRNVPADHLLFVGPPGLGKTTLARIIAQETGLAMVCTSGPVLERPSVLVSMLLGLAGRAVVFIDEIHRVPMMVEELLYGAMEDGELDLVAGSGTSQRSVRMALAPFTLVGATTQPGQLSAPLRDRFGFTGHLELYDCEALAEIVAATAVAVGLELDAGAAAVVASRSRGTPRVANTLTQRVRDFTIARGYSQVTAELAATALDTFGVDRSGLDRTSRKVLAALAKSFAGGPAGIAALAAAAGETPRTVEEAYEPHLVRQGLIRRTPRGRVLTQAGRNALRD